MKPSDVAELPAALQGSPEALDIEVCLTLVEEALRRETESEEPLIQEMARSILFAGGKRLRPRLTLLAYRAAGGEVLDEIVNVAAAMELIHAASLVHDDIIDEADLRRGDWAVHRRFGTGPAIVLGDFLFTRGYYLGGRLDEHLVRILAEAATYLAEGEVQEQRWTGRDELTLDEYLTIIRKKTAEPLRGAGRAGAHLAGADPAIVEALGRYGLALGLAFQIRDDLLDLEGDVGETGKPVGLDLDHGVRTLPILLHQEQGGTIPRFGRLPALRRALEQTNALERTRAIGREYVAQAVHHLEALPDTPYRTMLRMLAERTMERRS